MKSLMILTAVFALSATAAAHAQPVGDGGSCPAWTSLRCTAWSLGPPAKCTAYDCVADKKSDPIKNATVRQTRGKFGKLR